MQRNDQTMSFSLVHRLEPLCRLRQVCRRFRRLVTDSHLPLGVVHQLEQAPQVPPAVRAAGGKRHAPKEVVKVGLMSRLCHPSRLLARLPRLQIVFEVELVARPKLDVALLASLHSAHRQTWRSFWFGPENRKQVVLPRLRRLVLENVALDRLPAV